MRIIDGLEQFDLWDDVGIVPYARIDGAVRGGTPQIFCAAKNQLPLKGELARVQDKYGFNFLLLCRLRTLLHYLYSSRVGGGIRSM